MYRGEVGDLLTRDIHGVGFGDLVGILLENRGVAQFLELGLRAELRGGEHLGDGFRLLIGLLASLEGLGDEGEERGYDDHDEGRVENGIYVVVVTTQWSMSGAIVFMNRMASIMPSM